MRILSIFFVFIWVLLPGASVWAAPSPGSLVKRTCPASAKADDPCKAVYFYGHDGKRHAFPNEKTYFTWYADFSSVQNVSADFLASLPLGSNVTYRPGIKLVKFLTDPKVYAVSLGGTLRWVTSESAAVTLYGADWNKKVDDISDAFYSNYLFGTDIVSAASFAPMAEQSAAKTIDDDLPATHRVMSVVTTHGTFTADVIKLQKDRMKMVTDVAATGDCTQDCPTSSLSAFAATNTALIGMHGTYFCPEDYPDCATKKGSFLAPVYDSASGAMRNASALAVHEGPMMLQTSLGEYAFFHRTKDVPSNLTIASAISNYPSLVEQGSLIVETESRLDDGMKTIKSSRGGLGMDDRFVYLVIARSATVVDLARVFLSLGATSAFNLDGGGSSAMLWNGKYVVGPGRSLPNAVLFVPR